MTGRSTPSLVPPPRPTAEDDTFDRLRLLRSRRVGVVTFRRLLAEHGSAQVALDALPAVAQAAGVSNYEVCPEAVVQAELKAGKQAGARLIAETMPDYPDALRDLPDAPPLFWVLGNMELLQKPMIALVGARNASSLGTRMAKSLAGALGEAGFVVVSGLARGIDAAAHLGALASGTVAVQAGGVDVIYPAENTTLAHDIAKSGLRLSEMSMGLQPQARHFPARNRIISGLARAVVVVEAAAKSGSLITARNALDQGRDVLAVPGHPFDARAAGCNMLIRDGATLVRGAQDIIDALPSVASVQTELAPKTANRATPSQHVTAALQHSILENLGPTPIAEDQLLRDLGVSATAAAAVIVDLELEGKITRHPGGLLARVV